MASKESRYYIILTLLSFICVLGHYFAPPELAYVHEFLFKFTHVPIILAAIWFNRWFAIKLSTFFCFVYVLHIYLQLSPSCHCTNFSVYLDLPLYFALAWSSGYLSDVQKSQAQHLEKAYVELKEKASMILNFEEVSKKNDRYRTMAELSGSVAHEVRTPLSALQGAVEIVVSDSSDDVTKKKFSKMAFSEIQRINKVVDEFLKLGKQKTHSSERIDLFQVIESTLTLVSPISKKNQIKLINEIHPKTIVTFNADQLKQVLLNLLMNAISAIASSGEIKIYMKENEQEVEVFVSDSGTGISENIKEKLFEPFVTSREIGSGLGLYLSKNIMKSLDGDLVLEQSNQNGCVFKLMIPKVS